MAILLIYLRIFGVNKKFQRCTWVVMFFVCGYLFSNFWTQLLGCSPPSKYWNPDTPGHCINYTKAGFAYGSMNISSDFFIFTLPLPMIWRLKLSRKEKIGISLIFMSGAITCAVAIVRYYYVVTNNAADARYFVWSVMEINIGLICSCTVTLKPFFTHLKLQISQRGFKSIYGTVPSGNSRHKKSMTHGVESIIEMGRYRSVENVDTDNVSPLPKTASRMETSGDGLDLSMGPV
ncbi:hypothetical protein MMC07_007384 [Pseudocyphellaria aurata]|nr:hypothetical protein [Pseudocyphellaria aurata]